MVTDFFGSLLQELSKALEIADLHPDRNNSCLLKLKSGVSIQMEFDRGGNFLILGADLGTVPPGRYRENIFREALKANDLPHPIHGILAFSKKTDHLVLFERITIRDLNGEKIAAEITPFTEKAAIWLEALQRGDVPAITQVYSMQRSGGMFGLRP